MYIAMSCTVFQSTKLYTSTCTIILNTQHAVFSSRNAIDHAPKYTLILKLRIRDVYSVHVCCVVVLMQLVFSLCWTRVN